MRVAPFLSSFLVRPALTLLRRRRYIHGEILKRYPDVNAVVHSHAEDVLPYTVVGGLGLEPVYHMAGFLGTQARHLPR